MSAYAKLLVHTCHRRGAHAIGGMAAFIPSRRDEQANATAFAKVHEDKEREARLGFDGTWVAHPGLVPVAIEELTKALGDDPHQKHVAADADPGIASADLLDFAVEGGQITEAGLRANISVALQYINSWLNGVGAAAINNLMEDAATAEISRAQIWQWIRHGQSTAEGEPITIELYDCLRAEEVGKLGGEGESRYGDAAAILDELVHDDSFITFLTLPAYALLD
jgi:malate synthase